MEKTTIVNNDRCASAEFILLSIIDNKIDLIPSLHKRIFKYIKYIHIMKKTISIFDNNNISNIKKIINLYIARVNRIKYNLLGNHYDFFDCLITKHRCVMALILKNNSSNCNESVIFVPDLFPINEPDPVHNPLICSNHSCLRLAWHDHDAIMADKIFSVNRRDNFVIKNPIRGELYECNHPILNLLLSSGYIQCGVMEHTDHYFIGFKRYDDVNKITLVTPKKNDNIIFKPLSLCKIVKEFIVTMQNIKDNFGITDIPCYKILCNDTVENFINNFREHYVRDMIYDFKNTMQNNKNNCYYEYLFAYSEYKIATKQISYDNKFKWDDLVDDANKQITRYINMKRYSKEQRKRYNLNFRVIEFLI